MPSTYHIFCYVPHKQVKVKSGPLEQYTTHFIWIIVHIDISAYMYNTNGGCELIQSCNLAACAREHHTDVSQHGRESDTHSAKQSSQLTFHISTFCKKT